MIAYPPTPIDRYWAENCGKFLVPVAAVIYAGRPSVVASKPVHSGSRTDFTRSTPARAVKIVVGLWLRV